jgi:hypothetical protein
MSNKTDVNIGIYKCGGFSRQTIHPHTAKW